MQDGMFYRIGDFAYARNARQAVGYYLFHLLIGAAGFVLAMLAYGWVQGMPVTDATVTPELLLTVTAASMLYVAYVNYRLLEAKGLLRRPKYLALAALGVLVAQKGMLLGLLGVACFSILRPAAAGVQGDAVLNEEVQP